MIGCFLLSILFVIGEFRFDAVEIKNGKKHKGSQTGIETAVIENEPAVHTCRRGADDGADEACQNTDFPSVFTCKGTKTRCKGKSVDIALCGKHPGKLIAKDAADATNHDKKADIAKHDGSYISRMLSIRRECECCKGYADRGTCETGDRGQNEVREEHLQKFGNKENQIQIQKNRHSVYTEVDKADGKSEFVREIETVAGTFQKFAVTVEGATVHEKAEKNGCRENNEEKDIHEKEIGIAEGFIDGVFSDHDIGRIEPEGAIEKRMDKDAENTDRQSCFIHIVASVHCRCAGQKRRNDEAGCCAEYDCENHADDIQFDLTEHERTDGITEKEVADERGKRRGKHRNMKIFSNGMFCDITIDENADKGRPHIEKVQTVKAMRDNEQISGERGGIGFCFADKDEEITGKTAKSRIEKGACQTAKVEIVCDKLGRGC